MHPTKDMIYQRCIKGEGNKHQARDPYLVTSTDPRAITGQRMLRFTQAHPGMPKIKSEKLTFDRKFVSVPHGRPPSRSSSSLDWRAELNHCPPATQGPAWQATRPLEDEDDDIVWVSQEEEEPPLLPRQLPQYWTTNVNCW